SAHYPVHLRAVVTYNAADGNVFCMQDASGGIFIDAPGQRFQANPGDIVDVRGVTTLNGYAPAVTSPVVHVVGKAPLPRPLHLSFGALASGGSDGLFVTLSGVVRSVSALEGLPALRFDTGEGIVNVSVSDLSKSQLEALVLAKLKIQAVCRNLFNKSNQLNGVEFYVPGPSNIEVLERPSGDPFLTPTVSIDSLMRFAYREGGPSSHPVHLRGTVTYAHLRGAYLWDGTGGIAIQQSATKRIKPGDAADVVGFPEV